MANRRIGGTAYVKSDGKSFTVQGNLKLNMSAFSREGIAGMDGVHGYKETPTVPYISFDASYTASTDIETIHATTDATIQVELANGHVYLLSEAWFSGDLEIDGAEGKLGLKFEGISGKRIQ